MDYLILLAVSALIAFMVIGVAGLVHGFRTRARSR